MRNAKSKILLAVALVLGGALIPTFTAGFRAAPHRSPSLPQSAAQNLPVVRFGGGGNVAQIPMELAGNQIFAPVRINATQPSLFLVDSSQASSAIDEGRAGELGLTAVPSPRASGSENAAAAKEVLDPVLILPSLGIRMPSLQALPLARMSAQLGRQIQGLMGEDILQLFVVEIDYDRLNIQLYDPNSFEYAGKGVILPLALTNKLPTIRAKVDVPGKRQFEAAFVVDTSFPGAVGFSKAFGDAHKLTSHLKTRPSSLPAIGSSAESLQGRIKELQLGPLIFAQPVATFLRGQEGAPLNSDVAGAIGGELLRRLKLILDYPRQRLILETNGHVRELFETDMSGMTLTAEGPSLKTIRVVNVLEHSAASSAGIQKGDILAGIDGQPAVEYKLSDLREMFRHPEVEYKLTLDRNGKSIDVKIKLRRLI
ncbi:MAG: PDZ domain-containing protein [Candidatus Acidiferrales bacterium]